MIELPEQDHRKLHASEIAYLLAPSGDLQAIPLACRHYVGCASAVAADTARFAQLLYRLPASVVSEYDTQARRTAFGCLELREEGRADTLPGELA